MKKKGMRILLILTVLCFVFTSALAVSADTSSSEYNRYNVVFVVDASGSMKVTDGNEYRFDAMKLFASLLADGGNCLGGVVFNSDIITVIDPVEMNSQDDKSNVIAAIEDIPANGGTNIGLALDTAVNTLLENGNSDLPSVIVFLSDGNTDVPADQLDDSLEKKADAIQRAREEGIRICSVRLYANYEDDGSEMKQISEATGGLYLEIYDSDDLKDAFSEFYQFIYGTSSNEIPVPDPIPESGEVTADFIVPGLGVEEVNIIVYGQPAETVVTKPDGSVCNAEIVKFSEITTIKIKDADPGKWTIKIKGVPGGHIKVNMVFNSDLDVLIDYPDFSVQHYDNEDITVRATLKSGTRVSETPEQLDDFSATLYVLDAFGDLVFSEPMTVDGGSFVYTSKFNEGSYKFYISVIGNYLSKTTDPEGPVVIKTAPPDEPDVENTPTPVPVVNTCPEAVNNPVEEVVYIWPFIANSKTIDLSGLAKDKEDKKLTYRIDSSSFMESDYTLEDNNKLTITNFSLRKGAFTVKAYDSEGLSCDIEVIVVSHNIGVMALIGIGAAAIVVLIAIGVITYILLNKRFMGTCYVTPFDENGDGDQKSRKVGRGRLYLKAFTPLPDTGLDLNKCYFQATGKDYVEFIGKKTIYGDRKQGKKFRVSGNCIEVEISGDAEGSKGIRVMFKSDLIKDDLF